MDSYEKNSLILLAPLFIFLGAILIKDSFIILKKYIYPPPGFQKMHNLFRIKYFDPLMFFDNPDHELYRGWLIVEGVKSLVTGLFCIVVFALAALFALIS